MCIKNFSVNDLNCNSSTYPCKHYGMIETTDGSKYEGLICSGISNAIISNVSMNCLHLMSAPGGSPSNTSRILKFLTHIHFYQSYKDKPLSDALKELNFTKNLENITLTVKLEELKQVMSKVTDIGYANLVNSQFDQVPSLYYQLKFVTQNFYEFYDHHYAIEHEIRQVTPHLAMAELLLFNLSTTYIQADYSRHIRKLNNKSDKIKGLSELDYLYNTGEVQRKLDRLITVYSYSPKFNSKIQGVASGSLQQALATAEQKAYPIWQQGCEILKVITTKEKNPSEKADDKREKTLEKIEKTLEKIEKTHEKTNEKQADKSTPSDAFICPITQEVMIDPVITPNGISFERTAILAWLSGHTTCPSSRDPLRADQLIPNRALKESIENWKAQQSPKSPRETTAPDKGSDAKDF